PQLDPLARRNSLLPTCRADHGFYARAQALQSGLQGTPHSSDASGIGIQTQDDLVHVTSQEAQMAIGHRRTESGYDVAIPVLMGHGRVHVPLDDDDLAFLGHWLASEIEPEQGLLLVEQQRVSRVEVLWRDGVF